MPLDVEDDGNGGTQGSGFTVSARVVRVERDATGGVIPMPKLCNFYCFSNGACEEILVTTRCAAIQNVYLYSRVAAEYFKSVV